MIISYSGFGNCANRDGVQCESDGDYEIEQNYSRSFFLILWTIFRAVETQPYLPKYNLHGITITTLTPWNAAKSKFYSSLWLEGQAVVFRGIALKMSEICTDCRENESGIRRVRLLRKNKTHPDPIRKKTRKASRKLPFWFFRLGRYFRVALGEKLR